MNVSVGAQWSERTGYWAVTAMRWSFDKITGYGPNMNEGKWLQRIVFLETVAGVPGMVGGMVGPLASNAFLRERCRGHCVLVPLSMVIASNAFTGVVSWSLRTCELLMVIAISANQL